MHISGQGITGGLEVRIQREFTVDTTLALKWAQTESGSWVATDRGAAQDIYKTSISLHGRETSINAILSAIYANRTATHADANKLYLYNFADDEDIFGADVDYSSGIYCKVLSIGDRKQVALHSWTLALNLIALPPLSFTGTHAASITFDHINIGYTADVEYTFEQHELYGVAPQTTDRRADSGIIDFEATIKDADMVTFRRTLAYQRSAPITTTSLKGVTYPFGPNKSATWPKNLKYIQVKELERFGQHYHTVMCRCVEDL